jgi:hypothetical protein
MQFLKKHYEKILLGLVLVGLMAAAAFLPMKVGDERQGLVEKRRGIVERPIKPIEPLDLNKYENAIKLADSEVSLDLSSTNKVFNPVRWQLSAEGRPFPNPVGRELDQVEIVKITPLYFRINLESASMADSGPRYVILVEQQASAKANLRRRAYYVSPGEKKDPFTLLPEISGPPLTPVALTLELADTGEKVKISKDKPYQRVDGYMVDMKYPPENKNFINRRVGDRVQISGEEYNIVAITENEVVLSARSNGKKYTISENAGP